MDWVGIYGRWVKLSLLLIKVGAAGIFLGILGSWIAYEGLDDLRLARDIGELTEYALWATVICVCQLLLVFGLRWLITGELPKYRR